SLYRLSIEKSRLIPPTLDCMLGNLPQRIGTAEDAGFDDVAVLADQCLDGDHPGYESSFGSGCIGWPGHAEEPAALNDTSRQLIRVPESAHHDSTRRWHRLLPDGRLIGRLPRGIRGRKSLRVAHSHQPGQGRDAQKG